MINRVSLSVPEASHAICLVKPPEMTLYTDLEKDLCSLFHLSLSVVYVYSIRYQAFFRFLQLPIVT